MAICVIFVNNFTFFDGLLLDFTELVSIFAIENQANNLNINNKKSVAMKKKSFISALFMMLLCVSQSAFAVTYDFEIGRYQYKINDDGNTVTLVKYRLEPKENSPQNITVSETVDYNGNNYTVTALGDDVFNYFMNTKTITLPNTITAIGARAFASCEYLTSVNVPDGLTSIGIGAFSDCQSLRSCELPSTITEIPKSLFQGAGLESFTVQNTVTSIGESAFQYCDLHSVEISNSVTSIGDNAFCGADLQSVEIPASVTELGYAAFKGCSSLKSVVFHNSMKSLSPEIFYECRGLTSVTLPSTLTELPMGSFGNCVKLEAIEIPASVTSIGGSAFYNCKALTTINFPDGLTDIGGRAFYECYELEKLEFPDALKTIGDGAFTYCYKFAGELVFPNSVTTIGTAAFNNCGITSVHLGRNVKEIGANAFVQNNAITKVTCTRERPASIQDNTFDNSVYSNAQLIIPKGTTSMYIVATGWMKFDKIVESEEENPEPLKGDVNGDGRVNVSDVSALVNIILGIE